MANGTLVKNGIIYSGGSGSTSDYSTTEQVIGTWLGKTLYRKIYEIPANTISAWSGNSWKTILRDVHMAFVPTCVLLNYSDGTSYHLIADSSPNNHTNLNIMHNRNVNIGFNTISYLLVEYTKVGE